MKVLVVADGSLSSACEQEGTAWHMHLTLEKLGIEHKFFYHSAYVDRSLFTKGMNTLWAKVTKKPYAVFKDCNARANQELFKVAREFKPDLVIVFKAQFLLSDAVRELKRIIAPAKIVNFTFDNVFIYPGQLIAAKEYDIFYLADSYVLEKMHRAGCDNARFMSEPVCEQAHHEITDITDAERAEYTNDITMVGSLYPYRVLMLEALRGMNLKVWGNIWGFANPDEYRSTFTWEAFQHRETEGREKQLIFALSKINLTTLQPVECVHAGNERIQQTAACKGFQLCEYNPDLEKVYRIGEELVTFRSRDELREKAEYYLKHPELRQEVIEKAYACVMSKHTYTHRFQTMLADLGLSL